MSKRRTVFSLIINLIIFLVTTAVVISYFLVGSTLIKNGFESFMFFTTDSNVLAAIGALVTAVYDIKILRGHCGCIPRWAALLKYAGVIGLMLTFFTVTLLLIPLYGVELELGGTAFHMHVAAPVMSFVSFVFIEKSGRLFMRDTLIGILPVVIYGAVYFIQVIALKGWGDFYGFNTVSPWYFTAPVIIAASFGMSVLVKALHNKFTEKN